MSLELIFPEGKKVTVGGEKFTVKPFTFGQFPQAARLLQPMVNAFMKRGLLSFENDELKLSGEWPAHILNVMGEVGDNAILLCAFVINRPGEYFANVGIDEGAALVKTIFEVNSDFFKNRILPMVGIATESVTGQLGSTPSISSSPQDTPDAGSTDTP